MSEVQPGDEFTMRCTVTHVDEDGRIWFTRPCRHARGHAASNITAQHMADAIERGEIKMESPAKVD